MSANKTPAPANHWILCDTWDALPEGTWLVKLDKLRSPYEVAEVHINEAGNRFVIVGNAFSWDIGDPVAYAAFEPTDLIGPQQ